MTAVLYFWNHKWLLAITSGVLLGLSYPPFSFPLNLSVFAAFICIFRIADLTSSAREMAKVTYVSFLIWNIIATYWLTFATVPGGIAAILANSALMTLPTLFFWEFRNRDMPLVLSMFAIPSIWILFEFLHFRWDLSWPWLHLGNSFANTPWLVQYISITGISGITFWILCSSWLMYSKASRYLLIPVLFFPPLFSLFLYQSYTDDTDTNMEIAIVQPNYDSYQDLAGYDNPFDPLEELLERTSEILTENTRAIFWPENAIMALIREDLPAETDRMIQRYVDEWRVPLISGSSFLRRYDPGEAPPVVRTVVAGKPANVYNSALAFYPNGSMDYYKKAKLVPLVERFPFLHSLKKMDRFELVDWSQLAMFGRGTVPNVFEIDDSGIAALICYDSVYPDWVREFVLNGANLLVVITNDGWWGNTSGHIQHFEFARLRAIESRTTVMRSANNGISGVINPDGRVAKQTKYWTEDRFVYTVPLQDHHTFYIRHGDYISRFAMLLTCFSVGFILFRRWQARKYGRLRVR